MNKVELRSDPFNGARLTKEMLVREGLQPKQRIQVNGTGVWVSTPYQLGGGRIAVMGYVEENGGLVARSFYRSNSQGVWRYLPNYLESGGHIDWYGKGHSEESITLPIALQKALSTMSDTPLTITNPELVFAGSAKDIKQRKPQDPFMSYVVDVSPQGGKLDGNFYETSKAKIKPEDVTFTNLAKKPDFTKPLISRWGQNTALYGDVTVEVIPSTDGSVYYMFCRDKKGRAWIGGIEQDGKMTSHGIRQNWIKGGALTTPAYEYYSQSGGYGNSSDTNGPYEDMFKNYLSKIPIIQEYLTTRKAA